MTNSRILSEQEILNSTYDASVGVMNGFLTPAKVALSRTVSSSISTSTTVAITAGATFLRIYAKSQDVYLKWGATAVTSSNFDEVIPAGQVVDLYIPVESGTTLFTTCRIIEAAATATVIIIQK